MMLDSGDNEPPKRRGGPTKAEIAAKAQERHNSKGGRGNWSPKELMPYQRIQSPYAGFPQVP